MKHLSEGWRGLKTPGTKYEATKYKVTEKNKCSCTPQSEPE